MPGARMSLPYSTRPVRSKGSSIRGLSLPTWRGWLIGSWLGSLGSAVTIFDSFKSSRFKVQGSMSRSRWSILGGVRSSLSCHAEPFGKVQGKLREASALHFPNSFDQDKKVKSRFFVVTLLRMTQESKIFVGCAPRTGKFVARM